MSFVVSRVAARVSFCLPVWLSWRASTSRTACKFIEPKRGWSISVSTVPGGRSRSCHRRLAAFPPLPLQHSLCGSFCLFLISRTFLRYTPPAADPVTFPAFPVPERNSLRVSIAAIVSIGVFTYWKRTNQSRRGSHGQQGISDSCFNIHTSIFTATVFSQIHSHSVLSKRTPPPGSTNVDALPSHGPALHWAGPDEHPTTKRICISVKLRRIWHALPEVSCAVGKVIRYSTGRMTHIDTRQTTSLLYMQSHAPCQHISLPLVFNGSSSDYLFLLSGKYSGV